MLSTEGTLNSVTPLVVTETRLFIHQSYITGPRSRQQFSRSVITQHSEQQHKWPATTESTSSEETGKLQFPIPLRRS